MDFLRDHQRINGKRTIYLSQKVPMTKTVACRIGRKYSFGVFGHLKIGICLEISAVASLRADIRYSDFEAIVLSPRAKLDYTISKAARFLDNTKGGIT